jgi:hypothetical protein
MLLAVPPLDEGSNLTGALIHSIRTLERIEANRRAVYVFTDGHNDSGIPLTAVVEPAIAAGVSLTFLVIPSARSADLAVIQNVATATGGQFVSESVLVDFLRAPFAILDSGARASFPLANVRRFFWELESQIEVKFRYGTNELVLQAPVSLPVAGAGETTEYLLQNHPLVLAGSGAALLAVTFGGAFLVLRRRRPDGSGEIPSQDAAAEVPARPVFATLQNIADGTVYPLQGAVVAIGRDGANEIVLNDKSVTRRHAALVQGGFGGYTIEDQGSANGTFVNHERIQKKELAEGDLITVGSTTLLFTKLIETEADATPKADLA